MNIISLRRVLRSALAGVFVAAVAAGCASIGAGPRPAEEIVLERAQARWNALVDRDLAAAYPYLTPAYRARVPLQTYRRQPTGPAGWEGAKALSAKCEEKRCVVRVEVVYRLALPGHSSASSTHVDEIWVLEDGQWYKFEPL